MRIDLATSGGVLVEAGGGRVSALVFETDTGWGIHIPRTNLVGGRVEINLHGLPGREASPTVRLVKISLGSRMILLFRSFMALLSSIRYQTTTDAMRCERETKSWARLAGG